ncbi:radical SAM protein [Streptomyces stramineus]
MPERHRYLFVRILEACNADCFMCEYALSRDTFRFSLDDFDDLLPKALAAGVGYVRFTGGEPLMHRDVVELVRAGTAAGVKMSLITNGMLLPKMAERLAGASPR